MRKASQVKDILGEYISRQRAAKQFRLPAERALASKLGYSRATIGKALGVLEGEGLIIRKKGSGTFIANQGKMRTMTIALAMRSAYHCTDSHFRLIVDEVSKYAEQNNIYVQIFDRLVDMFQENPDNNNLMEAIKSGLIDGVLITSRMPVSAISRISAACPTVSINNIVGDGSEVPCISCDYFRVGFLAGKYLLENGHRKIAYVTDDLSHPESTFDFSGFSASLEMGGITLAAQDILETKQNASILSKRVLNFFKDSSYTACFIRNTDFTSQIASVLQKNGIRIPQDLSIISAGKYRGRQQGKLNFTVIDNQLDAMCRTGLDILCNLNNNTEGGIKLLEPKLIEHDSCRKIHD
jgi:DNA-binding LacI/PurR family transcriptional regulator